MIVSNKLPLLSIVGLFISLFVFLINIPDIWMKKEELRLVIGLLGPIVTVFSILWVVFGLIELYIILKDRKELYVKYRTNKIDKDNFQQCVSNYSKSLIINGLYLTTVLIQLVYVFINWNEKFDI